MISQGSTREEDVREGPTAFAKIVSASVGSTITALAVTPLEVVKVRQQAYPNIGNALPLPTGPKSTPLPSNVTLCSRGCGTFVLSTGLGEYLTPRSKCGYFDPTTGALKQTKEIAESKGTFTMLRKIFVKEGFAGIYAGLAPTLVMGIPNTVLYFYAYDELSARLKKRSPEDRSYLPAIAGASARFIASLSTAPLELLRTRQAARIGSAQGPYAEGKGMIKEFRAMIKTEGVSSLGRGVVPTLLRDVPFSAVYWLSIERMKDFWQSLRHQQRETGAPSSWEQAGQSFINGSVSGMIAAAVTTPLDVLKTRSQIVSNDVIQTFGTSVTQTASSTVLSTQQHHIGEAALCDHAGALVYHQKPIISTTTAGAAANKPQSTISIARNILTTEGIPGFWRGNTTRMIKVAPACGIMISSYEIGKRLLNNDIQIMMIQENA